MSATTKLVIIMLGLVCIADLADAQQTSVGKQQGSEIPDPNEVKGEACSRAATVPVFLSSTDVPDQMIVQIIGQDCSDPILAVTVSTPDKAVIYSHTFPALWASYDCGPVEACVDWVFENAVGGMSGWRGSELPVIEEALESDIYYDIDVRAYRYAQENDRPLLCYQHSKSGGACVVFLNGEAVHTHSSGT